jgi:hypothetical protein
MCYCSVYSNAQVRRSNIEFNEFRYSSKMSYLLTFSEFYCIFYFKNNFNIQDYGLFGKHKLQYLCVLVRDQWIE